MTDLRDLLADLALDVKLTPMTDQQERVWKRLLRLLTAIVEGK